MNDALADHETAKEVLGEDELKDIEHELTKTIKESMSVDWNVKEIVPEHKLELL